MTNAYRASAKLAIEASEIVEKTIDVFFRLNFGYDLMSKVMKVIKEHQLQVVEQKMNIGCELKIAVRKSIASPIFTTFQNMYPLKISRLEG